ncbi:MAG: hypothetical protein HY017_20045 [Betaproteobacteria bacterium]|nr:hypothetical protein [Betaproteobacteria bacterium]
MTSSLPAIAQEVDAALANLCAGGDIVSQRARLEHLGAAAVPRLLEHLHSDYRKYSLYALQHCWAAAAVEPVAELLTNPELDTRRMAAILLDRHLGREYLAQRCADHFMDSDPEVAGFCFEHAELMFPDAERALASFAVPHLRWRLARRLPRYYARALAAGTRSLISEHDAEVARAGIVALIHHDDGDPAGRALIGGCLTGDEPKLREAAAEFLAWRGSGEDLEPLVAAAASESDPFARASQVDAIAAIRRRIAAGSEVGHGPAIDLPAAPVAQAAYREAVNRLEANPSEDDCAYAQAVCATAEPFEPRLYYTGNAPSAEFVVTRRLRDRLMARLLAMPWCESVDPQEVAPTDAPRVAESIVAPTRSTLTGEAESYGVYTNADDRAFKSLVHVGDDVSWQEDHAAVLVLADGVVRAVRCEPSWGYLVIVEHSLDRGVRPALVEYAQRFAKAIKEPVLGPQGEIRLCSLYAHLGAFIRVRPGEIVRAGQKLGVIGRTLTWENGGYPAHLHLGLHLGPFVQTPRPNTKIDVNFRDKRYRARVVRAGSRGIETTIHYRGDPEYPVIRTRRWECGYIARWYWDGAAHGWLSTRALLRHPSR